MAKPLTAAMRAALREALALDDARIDQAVRWARQAGYRDAEIPGRLIEAANSPEATSGRKPRDRFRAAICKGSPKSLTRDDGHLASAFRSNGIAEIDDWADFAQGRRPITARECALECAQELARRMHPGRDPNGHRPNRGGGDRQIRRHRNSTCAALEAGQRSFGGAAWGV